ncbi:cytochrome c550 [Desertibacillus haloalkaliphilus]|uniref:cytochrome c550 n=1 Tax=Desertibacillus haloalkaliphilus TaxID=1328930 RepID=UPI001C27A3BB|nr:cytochrome c [Desertibacillus haloalkaliphilus]MBU8905682.1 cytochrome c [Desertibacillus haloalkaliphilus]
MKGKPLVPFAVTAVLGILLMIVLSLVGLNHQATLEEGDGEEVEEVVEFDDPIQAGEDLVNQSCISCHGNDLTGVSGPAINALEGQYSEDEIADIVLNGIGGMPAMPHNEVEAEAIATYLLSISE